jgi:hypothetical protein
MFESMAKMGLKKLIRDNMHDGLYQQNLEDLLKLIGKFTDNEFKIDNATDEFGNIIVRIEEK